MKVFLSYGPADQKAATALAEALAAEGVTVWDPATEILPGDNHGRLVGEALEEAEGMVVLVSPGSMQSPSVQRDISYALGKLRYAGRVVPVIIKPARRMPWILERFPQVSWTDDVRSVARKVTEWLEKGYRPAKARLQPA
jgi:TIR domain